MKITLLATLALSCGLATANDKQTMIIFDASGSMWGQIDGQAKITLAQNALADISSQWQPNQKVGLMAYGHRNKGDCDDIETLVPIASGQSQSIIQQVKSIKPKGKTPIAASLQQAVDAMKIAEQASEIILISDGLETCDLNPCQVAAEAEQAGIDFTAHVIGFGLSQDQGKQLSCVADVTGGRYVAAQDAAGLASALTQVLVEPDPEPVQDTLPQASITAPENAPAIGTSFPVAWTGPNGKNDYIDIVKPNDHRLYDELSYAWTQTGQPVQIKAPGEPGTYQLRYVWQGQRQKHVLASTTFEVKDSEVSLMAPQKSMAGEAFTVEWTGPNQNGDYVDLVPSGNNKTYGELAYFYTKIGPSGVLTAPVKPGDYDIRYVLEAADGRKVLHRIPIEIAVTEITLAAPKEVSIGESFDVFWTGPNNPNGYIDLVKRDDKRTYGELSYFYLKDHPESGPLNAHVLAGEYDIRFIMEGSGGRAVMATKPLTILPVAVTLQAPEQAAAEDVITVQWQGPGSEGDYIDLVKHNDTRTYGELSYFYTKGNPGQGTLKLPSTPGTYTIRYVIQGKTREILSTRDIFVE